MSQQSNLTESVHKKHDSKSVIETDDIEEEEELDPRVQVPQSFFKLKKLKL